MRKNAQKLSEKLGVKFPARGYSMAKRARIDDALLEVFERKTSQ